VLLVEWDSVEAHRQNFRATDRYVQWRALIGGFFLKPPLVEHFADVEPGQQPGPELPEPRR
jgi:hypothetical protein